MPYPPEHKQKTHERIVRVASRMIRATGFAATGVDKVMAAAGLTRGGFYAHFEDKWALVAEAIDHAFDEARENMLGGLDDSLDGDAFVRVTSSRYLSRAHAEHPANGCALPALGADVARAPDPIKRVFRDRLDALVDEHAARYGGPYAKARKRMLATFSTWVGALLLARAVSDPTLADEILIAARDSLGVSRRERDQRWPVAADG